MITHSPAFLPRILYLFSITHDVINKPKLLHCVRLDSSRWLMILKTTGVPGSTCPSTACAHTSVSINPKATRRPLSTCQLHFLLPAVLSHDCLRIKWALICSFSLGTWLEDSFILSIKLNYGLCDSCFFNQKLFPFISRLVVVLLGIGFVDKWEFPLLPHQIFKWDSKHKGFLKVKVIRTTIISTSPTTTIPNFTKNVQIELQNFTSI